MAISFGPKENILADVKTNDSRISRLISLERSFPLIL
jgi:hypothetical protein